MISQKSKTAKTWRKKKVWREYPSQNPKNKKNSRKPKKNKGLERISQATSKNKKTSRKQKKQRFGENLPGNLSFRGLFFFVFFCFFGFFGVLFFLFLWFFVFFSILGLYRTVCRFFPAEACLIVFIVIVGSLHHFS